MRQLLGATDASMASNCRGVGGIVMRSVRASNPVIYPRQTLNLANSCAAPALARPGLVARSRRSPRPNTEFGIIAHASGSSTPEEGSDRSESDSEIERARSKLMESWSDGPQPITGEELAMLVRYATALRRQKHRSLISFLF